MDAHRIAAPMFDAILHLVQGKLVAPYLSSNGMLVVVIYDCNGGLVNIEVSNIPEGTLH